ncbi:4Fe-4S binding protein [Candidatus Solincola tengchongensis]|uniref:4Fe-4S binding protein n=1 Tax=Candidatus Solincola tengchongensis TaxID=2900693 RepID=UPI00257EA7B5
MSGDEVYRKLWDFLDRMPLGFPSTSSGVELRILKRLFSEEEAEMAVHLSPLPEDAETIAGRCGMDVAYVSGKLEDMSRKGLVFRTRRGGRTLYNTAPFMIGLYEYSVEKMDEELASLYREYYEAAYMMEMAASGIPGFKVLPIGERVQAPLTAFPYLDLVEEVKRARVISVADCICRKEAAMTGEACGYPRETCLSFGAAAEYYIENGIGREIDAEEALRILRQADEAGLIHAGVNTKHLSNICNCCPCCCASMKGITKRGMDKRYFLNALFEAVVDAEECTACGVCVGRCPVGAVRVEEEAAVVDRERCLGCGLCAGTCPAEAISVVLREDREEPFERVVDMGLAILERKGVERGGGLGKPS